MSLAALSDLGPAEAASGAGTPAAVLLVDDNADQRVAVRAMLARLRSSVVEVDSGRAALRAVATQSFAVILMDVRMPIMDGYETAKRIRARSQSVLTPIIFLTAFARDEAKTAGAYPSGPVDFLFAPIAPAALRAKVSAFLDVYAAAPEHNKRSLDSITALNASLRDSEMRARAVLQYVADGVVTAGEQGVIESLNRSAQRLFGYEEEEVIGQPLQDIIAPSHRDHFAEFARFDASLPGADDAPRSRSRRSAVARTARVFRWRSGSARCRSASIRSRSVPSTTSQLAWNVPLSERQRGQALRREAQLDRVAFEEAPIGSVITGRDGPIERANHAICNMLGHTADELSGAHLLEFTHPEDRDASRDAVAALLSGASRTQHFEGRYLHSSGRIIEARIALTAIRDDAQRVAQLFAQIEDVTDARRTTRELKQAQFEMLARLAAAAELHDDATGQHTHRVGVLSGSIAQRLGLPAHEVELLRLAAPLHDVGKIAIPDAVLAKRGKLSVTEYAQMQTHTTVGAQMLAGSPFALLEMAEQSALTHHERWDGRGYPAGLAGEAIPIAGRIVAVADVFDALTHTRPYKAAWSASDAIAEMTGQSGRQFDPQVLDAFLGSR